MATRSIIGIRYTATDICATYCHWDGYLANNGAILDTYYKDVRDVASLVALGYISSLGAVPMLGKADTKGFKTLEGFSLYCSAEHTNVSPTKFKSIEDFLSEDIDAEFFYLFDVQTKKWFYSQGENLFHPIPSNPIKF